MPTTDTTENGLETLIIRHMTGVDGFFPDDRLHSGIRRMESPLTRRPATGGTQGSRPPMTGRTALMWCNCSHFSKPLSRTRWPS